MNKNNLTPAATVLLFKNSAAGPKVFMVKRSKKPPFENLYVFPGGKVDQDDGSSKMYDLCKGLNDEKASSQLNRAQSRRVLNTRPAPAARPANAWSRERPPSAAQRSTFHKSPRD